MHYHIYYSSHRSQDKEITPVYQQIDNENVADVEYYAVITNPANVTIWIDINIIVISNGHQTTNIGLHFL